MFFARAFFSAKSRILQFLYAGSAASPSFLYAPGHDNAITRPSPYSMWPDHGEIAMSVMDGISLLMGVGLFIYLLVALLRADQN